MRLLKPEKQLEMPKAKSDNGRYFSQKYQIDYSQEITNTAADFYDTLTTVARLANGTWGFDMRASTAAEEHRIFLSEKPGRLKRLERLLVMKPEWAYTITGLEVPQQYACKNCVPGDKLPATVTSIDIYHYMDQIADPKFSKENWRDFIRQITIPLGDMEVPFTGENWHSNVSGIDPLFGLFSELTYGGDKPVFGKIGYPKKDPISGRYEYAVTRGETRFGVPIIKAIPRCEYDAGAGFRAVWPGKFETPTVTRK